MFFMCFFEAPPPNVLVNWLVKWVVLTSPLEWNYEIFSKILPLNFVHQFLRNSVEKREEEQALYLFIMQVLISHF